MNILIIGGGFAGCASAEILSKLKGTKITLIEKADFLGAGVRTNYHGGHPYTYGPRHFLTDKPETYEYLKKKIKLRNVDYHQFKAYVKEDNRFYNLPINQKDIDSMPEHKKINKEIKGCKNVERSKNLEEYWKRSIGSTLFKRMIEEYNKKMWQVKSCKELDTFNWSAKGYTIKKGPRAGFGNWISMYPIKENGYNDYFDNIKKIKNVKVFLKTSFNKIDLKKKICTVKRKKINYDILINTISPDELFNKKYGELEFIGRDFYKIILPIKEAFPKDVFFLYYPDNQKFTRLVEYKKFTRHKSSSTLIGMELPSNNGRFYPIPIKKCQKKAKKYFNKFPEWHYSIGRAGTYRYEVDIDDCIWQALRIKDQLTKKKWLGPIVGEQFKIK